MFTDDAGAMKDMLSAFDACLPDALARLFAMRCHVYIYALFYFYAHTYAYAACLRAAEGYFTAELCAPRVADGAATAIYAIDMRVAVVDIAGLCASAQD